MKDYLTAKEAAEYCKINYQDMIVLLRRLAIPSEKKGEAYFVHKNELDKWLQIQENYRKINL